MLVEQKKEVSEDLGVNYSEEKSKRLNIHYNVTQSINDAYFMVFDIDSTIPEILKLLNESFPRWEILESSDAERFFSHKIHEGTIYFFSEIKAACLKHDR